MDFTTSMMANAVSAKIRGPITAADSSALNQLFKQLTDSGQAVVRLDLSLVPLITSTGIGKLIVLYKRLKNQNGELRITGIHENVLSLFTAIHLDKMITIEKMPSNSESNPVIEMTNGEFGVK